MSQIKDNLATRILIRIPTTCFYGEIRILYKDILAIRMLCCCPSGDPYLEVILEILFILKSGFRFQLTGSVAQSGQSSQPNLADWRLHH